MLVRRSDADAVTRYGCGCHGYRVAIELDAQHGGVTRMQAMRLGPGDRVDALCQ